MRKIFLFVLVAVMCSSYSFASQSAVGQANSKMGAAKKPAPMAKARKPAPIPKGKKPAPLPPGRVH